MRNELASILKVAAVVLVLVATAACGDTMTQPSSVQPEPVSPPATAGVDFGGETVVWGTFGPDDNIVWGTVGGSTITTGVVVR
jgi:hypothetical protein